MKYQIFRKVNANAHSLRYGRDCHAPAVACGVVEAPDAYQAQAEAERLGLVYCPDAGQYEYLFDRAEPVARAEDENYRTVEKCDGCGTLAAGTMHHAAGATGRVCPVLFLCDACAAPAQAAA